MTMFHYPLAKLCPISWQEEYQRFDKFVKITMKSIRFRFLMEYMFRMQDYFFCQLLGALSDTNPYLPINEAAQQKFDRRMGIDATNRYSVLHSLGQRTSN